jgi:hypothetical protein
MRSLVEVGTLERSSGVTFICAVAMIFASYDSL